MSKKINNFYAIPLALLWIGFAIWLALKVQYQDMIAEIADPLGTSTPGETFLKAFIVIVSLLPGTFILSHALINRITNKSVKILLTIVLSIGLTLALYYYVFGWLNFIINF